MSKPTVYVMHSLSDEDCALSAESLYRSGITPILIHRTSSASADAVVRYLRARPDAPSVRRSPDDESVAAFNAAIIAHPTTIHVYYEQFCDVCGALPPLYHVSLTPGFYCASCARSIVGPDAPMMSRSQC